MKLALCVAITLVLTTSAFYIGQKVGISKGIMFASTAEASAATRPYRTIRDIDETLESYLQDQQDESIEIQQAAISLYGEYLNHWTSKLPGVAGIDALIHKSYGSVIADYQQYHSSEKVPMSYRADFDRAIHHFEQ